MTRLVVLLAVVFNCKLGPRHRRWRGAATNRGETPQTPRGSNNGSRCQVRCQDKVRSNPPSLVGKSTTIREAHVLECSPFSVELVELDTLTITLPPHANVVRLLGFCIDYPREEGAAMALLMPLHPGGSLRSFVLTRSKGKLTFVLPRVFSFGDSILVESISCTRLLKKLHLFGRARPL